MRLTSLPRPPSDLPPHQRPMVAGRNHVVVTDWRTPSAWLCDLRDGAWRRYDPPEVVRPVARLPDGAVWATSETAGHFLDADTGRWSSAPPSPKVRQAIATAVEDEVLLVGGLGADAGTSWRGDPRTGSWRKASPLPRLRLSPGTVARLPDGRLVFAGSNVGAHPDVCGSADVYDPAADAWTSLPCSSARALTRRRAWPWQRWDGRRVKSVWGVVMDVLSWGDRLVFPLARRYNQTDRWSVVPVPTFAVYDGRAERWGADLSPPDNAQTSLARFVLGDALVCAGWYGLDAWDGARWTRHPWPDDERPTNSATSLDDGRVLLLGRDAAAVATASSATAA